MEVVINDSNSKDFLRDISAVHPEYKESCSAVSNLIILLMEELQKERKGRKRGEKFECILEPAEEIEIMSGSRRFDKGAIRVVSTRWVRD